MKTIDTLTRDEERAAELFRALGNPARVHIVMELARRSTCQTGDLVGVLPLAQSTVSQHLKVLRDAGIVRGAVEGDQQCYCLDPAVLTWLREFMGSIEAQVCC